MSARNRQNPPEPAKIWYNKINSHKKGGFAMDTPRIYEEDGYIHFMLRPEDLMRLRYS